MSHFGLMTLYAFLLGGFFAVLWRRERRDQWRLFWQVFGGLLAGALVLGWLMYLLPPGPPPAGP